MPSTASADAPDIVRYRFDKIRNDANALGAELNLSSIAAVKEGAGTGIGVDGGCGGCGGCGAAGVTGARVAFDFFSFEEAIPTLESDS